MCLPDSITPPRDLPGSADGPAAPGARSPARQALSGRRAAESAFDGAAAALVAVFRHHLGRAVARRALAGDARAARLAREDFPEDGHGPDAPAEPDYEAAGGIDAWIDAERIRRNPIEVPPGISREPWPDPYWLRGRDAAATH